MERHPNSPSPKPSDPIGGAEISSASLLCAGAGAAAGLLCATAAAAWRRQPPAAGATGLVAAYSRALRSVLPRYVILVRHGESQGNADHTLYRTTPDNRALYNTYTPRRRAVHNVCVGR